MQTAQKSIITTKKKRKTVNTFAVKEFTAHAQGASILARTSPIPISRGEFKHRILKLTLPKTQPKEIPNTTKYIEID